jgi:hypothetical protein
MKKITTIFTQGLVSSAVLTTAVFAAAALTTGAAISAEGGMSVALPNAKAGECYAKVMIPATFKSETQEVVKRAASERIEIIPATYKTAVEQILIKPGSEKIVPVPAVYGMVKEKIEIEPARNVWQRGSGSKARLADHSLVAGAHALGLPKSAEVGQCFVEYHQPDQYKTEATKVLIREASKKYDVAPAQYERVKEKVLVREASEKLIEVPAQYETVTEKVLERAAYTTWKKGRGPVERVDNGTGEIMCLVEVPAKYKIIKKRILKSKATTRKESIPAKYIVKSVRKLIAAASKQEVEIPAEYKTVTKRIKTADAKTSWVKNGVKGDGKKTARTLCMVQIPAKFTTVKKRVVKTPASVKTIAIPAAYQAQKVRKLVTAAQEKRIEIPAVKQMVTKRIRVSSPKLEWRSILCETNMTKNMNLKIQNALHQAGYNPGTIDGVIGRQTLVAVDEFQKKNNLPTGGLTLLTLEKLGISL